MDRRIYTSQSKIIGANVKHSAPPVTLHKKDNQPDKNANHGAGVGVSATRTINPNNSEHTDGNNANRSRVHKSDVVAGDTDRLSQSQILSQPNTAHQQQSISHRQTSSQQQVSDQNKQQREPILPVTSKTTSAQDDTLEDEEDMGFGLDWE
jgi:hypothetical protein